ncbi:hypothetical protein BCR43DRAFT_440576 [Syncephalastrum racemosum]|uniref:RRM domain-containing protein n=1 Tax=Syncephalastrum racemosum TaxID=13706 RepID=A0A1X2HD23_SYNRA|nr:hypothetical protein BCR43DRAFT_440576 [Syncephalastrum racemosum]
MPPGGPGGGQQGPISFTLAPPGSSVGAARPPAPGFPPAPPGSAPPAGFSQQPPAMPAGQVPVAPTAAAAATPSMINGVPTNKQPLNTVPSRTVYAILKNTLRNLFNQFGEVQDVVAYSSIRARGQAFVAYKTEEEAGKAIQELQHFALYGKPMVVQYARGKSDVQAKADGDFETHHAERLKRKEARKHLPLPGANKPQFKQPRPKPGKKKRKTGGCNIELKRIPDEYLPPNNILFLQNLPETITQQQIVDQFTRFPGFREVRMIPTKKSIAFVEYETESQAGTAKTELTGYQFAPEVHVKITYARK